jgi:hypothetical protein
MHRRRSTARAERKAGGAGKVVSDLKVFLLAAKGFLLFL